MDRFFLELLLSKVANPARGSINYYDNKYYYIESVNKTNDTLGWYHINSNIIEEELERNGYSWCYVFETAPKHCPVIYMYFGKQLSKEVLMGEFGEVHESLPEGINIYIEDAPFSAINIDQYDDSKTVLEKELLKRADVAFTVYEP